MKGQGHRGQRSNLCFFCLFPYFSQVLGPIFTKLEGGPGYYLEGFIFKGQGHRGQRSNFCISRSSRSKVKFVFSVCSPTSPRSLGRSSPNLVGRLRAAPDISSRGSFLKVKVIEVKDQILYLGSPWSDLHETW